MRGDPESTRLDLLGREEGRENQTYWKAKIGYNMRWWWRECFRYSSVYSENT